MNTNPYAPPTANVEDVSSTKVSPALWNPSAAARWSFLLSPIFGAILHMKNWQALGESEKAVQSRYWVLGNIAFFLLLLVASFILPDSKVFDVGARGAGF